MVSCITFPTQIASTWVELLTGVGGLVTAFFAAAYGLRQAYVANRLHRSEMLQSILEKYNSEKISESIKIIESGTLAWPISMIKLPEEVKKKMYAADPALLFFSDLCYLKACDVISNQEFAFFEWKIRRVVADASIENYLNYLVTQNAHSPFARLLSFTEQKRGWRKYVKAFALKLLAV